VGVQFHGFLTTAIVGSEWSVSSSDSFTPGKRAPFYQWFQVFTAVIMRNVVIWDIMPLGDWIGLRAGLDD
jgi:hypothetical protein